MTTTELRIIKIVTGSSYCGPDAGGECRLVDVDVFISFPLKSFVMARSVVFCAVRTTGTGSEPRKGPMWLCKRIKVPYKRELATLCLFVCFIVCLFVCYGVVINRLTHRSTFSASARIVAK